MTLPSAASSEQPEAPTVRSPCIEHLGIEFVRLEPEEVELHLPIRAEFMNTLGIVHGGICAGLADTALGTGTFTLMARK